MENLSEHLDMEIETNRGGAMKSSKKNARNNIGGLFWLRVSLEQAELR